MHAEFEKEVMHTNIKIPHEVKSTRYFQLSGYKKIRQHVLLSQESRSFILGKNSFHYHETRPVKIIHFDMEFPSISPSNFAEDSESGKLLNTSTIQLTTHSVSVFRLFCLCFRLSLSVFSLLPSFI